MTAQISPLRRLASALTRHAARVLPASRSDWAQAMRSELDHIESDVDAIRWAIGCMLAGYVERSRIMHLLDTGIARAILTLALATQVLSFLFATVLTLAWRLHYLGLAAFLGSFTPGDDYRRFIPLMDSIPWWIHAMWVSASILFFASAWQLIRKQPSAFLIFACGWILGTAGNLIGQASPVYRAAFSFPEPMFTRDYLIPAATALIPILIAAALWTHSRYQFAGN